MKNVLFIANLSELYYYEAFLKACVQREKVRIYIFDPIRVPREASVSISLDNQGVLAGFIDVLEYKAGEFVNHRLFISDIHVAWYLRERSTQTKKKELSLDERFSENESRGTIRSLLTTLPCRWVNQKGVVDSLESNKLYQQLIACQSGLLIPRTLVSNDPESIVTFSDPKEGLLLKSVGYIRLDEDGKKHLYSQRFSHQELSGSPKAIRRCPVFCQEYVQKLYEHRVMVIGNKVLACRIDSQASEQTKIDWRHYDFERVAHVRVELPQNTQQKLLCFMRAVNLQYGAIDLIETPQGEFIFLEVNPSGQWGWIADLAGLPIAEAVAEMLENI